MNFERNIRIKRKACFPTGRAAALICTALAVAGLVIALKREPVEKPTGRELVSGVLDQVHAVETAHPKNITDEGADFTALGDASVSHAFLEECLETAANPIGQYTV